MRLSPPHIPTIHLPQTYSMYLPSRLSNGKEERTKYVHAHEASPKVELTTSSLPSVSFPCVETISGLTEQANHVSLVSNSSSLHENFCFPCVLSRCQKRQSRLIFNPYSRLTIRPSSTPPHPYWPAQLNPFNVPLRSDTFPTAEASVSLVSSRCRKRQSAWMVPPSPLTRERPKPRPGPPPPLLLFTISTQHFSHSGYHRLFSAN